MHIQLLSSSAGRQFECSALLSCTPVRKQLLGEAYQHKAAASSCTESFQCIVDAFNQSGQRSSLNESTQQLTRSPASPLLCYRGNKAAKASKMTCKLTEKL
jgi:hypothetical protein